MTRLWLAIGAVIVLAGGIVLWMAIRDDGAASAKPSSTTSSSRASGGTPPSTTRDGTSGVRVPEESGTTVRDVPSEPEAREYYVDGKRVRDHRRNPKDRVQSIEPVGQPPGVVRKISSTITHAFSTQIQAAMKECAAQLPSDARGAKPRVEGQVFLAIKDKQARITEATLQLRDVTGAAVDAAKTCIEQKSVGLTTSATDEADVERYSITLSLSL